MKSIVLRGIPDDLYNKLKSRSKKESINMNKILLSMVESNFSITGKSVKKKKRFTELDGLFGRWSSQEYEKMKAIASSQREIDEELWK
jgi:hypothetical protein